MQRLLNCYYIIIFCDSLTLYLTVLLQLNIKECVNMATNKSPFTFNMDEIYLNKMRYIAKQETRSLSNLLEHLCKLHIEQYEKTHGEIKLSED